MNKLTLALIGALVPVVLVGCGGGNGFSPAKTQSGPQPTARPTATPAPGAPIALTPTTFTLGNGQRVTLTGTRMGTQLKGNLKVEAAPLSRLQTGSQNVAFPFSIAIGNYGYTGTLTPPRGFTINGNFGALGSFQMSGQLQTATQNGSYSLTTNGTTDTGILPATGATPTSTATPIPTTAPAAGSFKLTGDLRFTNATAGSPVITAPLNSFLDPGTGTFGKSAATPSQSVSFGAIDKKFNGNGTNSGVERGLSISVVSGILNPTAPAPLSVNQRFDLAQNRSFNIVQYTQSSVNGTAISFRFWRATAGELVVRALGTNSITLELVAVRMQSLTITGAPDASAGEFNLAGTVTATGLTVQTN